jgi:hypothetical protein
MGPAPTEEAGFLSRFTPRKFQLTNGRNAVATSPCESTSSSKVRRGALLANAHGPDAV